MRKRLPRNKREGIVYGAIICAISVAVMATMNICIGMGGVSKEALLLSLKVFPIVFVIAMSVESIIVEKIASKMVKKFSEPTDSFNAYILFNIFFTIIGMSIIMTIVGGILSNGFSAHIIEEFIHNWPRNFCVVFFLELIVAQPIARMVMRNLHEKADIGEELV